MKKLLFAVSALAALSLLAPSAGFAQFHDYDNVVGIFADEAATLTEFNGPASVPFFVYVVLLRPSTLDGTAYPDINAFEMTVTSSDETIFVLSQNLPAGSVNVGDNASIVGGLEYIVGLSTAAPVVDQRVVLFSLQMFSLTGNAFQLFVGPTSKPGIAGEMAFQSVSPLLVPMYAASGGPGDGAGPVFGYNTSVVATEDATWGGVKALYR